MQLFSLGDSLTVLSDVNRDVNVDMRKTKSVMDSRENVNRKRWFLPPLDYFYGF